MPRPHPPRWGQPHHWIQNTTARSEPPDGSHERAGPRSHDSQQTRVHSAPAQRPLRTAETSSWEWDVQHLREGLKTELQDDL